MTVDGAQLESLWTAASRRWSTSAYRTAVTGVECSDGPLLAAVGRDDRRALLIPIRSAQTMRENPDGRAVVLRRRRLEDDQSIRDYACLELVDPQYGDLFTALCAEVVQRVAVSPDKAVAALHEVLSDWKSLLAPGPEMLSPSALAGLFAELHVLREWVRYDSGAVAFWTGPDRAAHDFRRGLDAVEVKATTSAAGRRARINGTTQLDLAPPGRLILRWFRLAQGEGTSVPALVDEILELSDDPAEFRRLLWATGYCEHDRDVYERRLFAVLEHRAYEVGPNFPRIVPTSFTGGGLPAGVEEIEYVIDLDSVAAETARIDDESLREFLEQA